MRPLLLALLTLSVGGCSFFRAVTGGLARPTLAYESWSADALDLEGVTVVLHYRLENPNGLGLDLRSVAYRLEVEGQQVAEGDLPGGLQVAARAAVPVAFPVRIRWRDVPGFLGLLTARDSVAYRITGHAALGTELGTVDVPFDHADRVALPRVPSLSLEGVEVRHLSLASVALDLRVRVENRNAFPLPVGALTYGLRLGEGDLLASGSHPLAAVPPGGHATFSIPVRLSAQGLADAASALLRGAEVTVRGAAGFGGVEVPFEGRRRAEESAP